MVIVVGGVLLTVAVQKETYGRSLGRVGADRASISGISPLEAWHRRRICGRWTQRKSIVERLTSHHGDNMEADVFKSPGDKKCEQCQLNRRTGGQRDNLYPSGAAPAGSS